MMAGDERKSKPLMRSLGEFFGHVMKGVRTDPAKENDAKGRRTQEVRRTTEEERREGVILRRTTIEEVEFTDEDDERDTSTGDGRDEPST